MKERACGTCNACCMLPPILEPLNKTAGVWCKHCDVGIGCSIYKRRPKQCRDFLCQWILGEGEEEERPDKIGLMFDMMTFPVIGMTFLIFEFLEGKLNQPLTWSMTDSKLEQGIPVCHLPLSGNNKLYVNGIKIPPNYNLRVNNRQTNVCLRMIRHP